jgi:hypothetical protein
MKVTHLHGIGSLLGLAVIGLAGSLAPLEAWSQQKYSLSYTAPPAASRYTEEHVIDVGDVPGHQVRAFDRFSRIRGTIRTTAERIVGAPALSAQFAGEYWFEE